jgi:hypothetical protein
MSAAHAGVCAADDRVMNATAKTRWRTASPDDLMVMTISQAWIAGFDNAA